MEKSNVMISVIIVICIAAAVTAYGLSNPDNSFFSEFQGIGGSGGNGLGNNSGGSGQGPGGSGGSGSGGSPVYNPSNPPITQTDAERIANDHILEEGCYAGTAKWNEAEYCWIVPVLNANGNQVGTIIVDGNTGNTILN